MRYELSDQEWSVIRAMLPTKPRGIPRVDDRRVLNGIFWVLRSGAPWRDLPPIYGPRTTCLIWLAIAILAGRVHTMPGRRTQFLCEMSSTAGEAGHAV